MIATNKQWHIKLNKVLVLFASSHVDGKTSKLLKFYLNELVGSRKNQANFFEVKKINIYDLKILPCDGCGFCKHGEGCPKNEFDDFSEIVSLIKRSNCFVVATPTYFSGFPAKLKALIDRCEQFYCSKTRLGRFKNFKKLQGSLVLTAGGANFNCLKNTISSCKQFFDCIDVEFEMCLAAPRTDTDGLFFLIN